MEVLLDMDGVLVDFMTPALELHGVDNLYDDPKHKGNWNTHEILGMTMEEFLAPMTVDFWSNLDWTHDGRSILKQLEKREICLLSNAITPTAMEGKLKWIEKHLPEYKNKYLFGPTKYLAGSHKRILIDDSDRNIKEYKAKGFPAILVPRPWNSLHKVSENPFRVLL